jgi:NNP family nitrate/nitrite transporter-like MFS transporter
MPLGNYRELAAAAVRKKDTSPNAWKAALLNYRSWVMCLNYGYCFGIELVVDNVITYYLYDQFRLNAVVAGAMGSIFGCVSSSGFRVCDCLGFGV